MSLARRLNARGRRVICERLVAEVGGYLRNMVREPNVTCAVCGTPVTSAFDVCRRCHRDRGEFGSSLADLVVPLWYGIRGASPGT